MATSEMDRDQTQAAQRVRHAHDVIDGCILSLAISDSAKRSLQRELEALYEAAIYPLVAPSAAENRTYDTKTGGSSAFSAGSVDPDNEGRG